MRLCGVYLLRGPQKGARSCHQAVEDPQDHPRHFGADSNEFHPALRSAADRKPSHHLGANRLYPRQQLGRDRFLRHSQGHGAAAALLSDFVDFRPGHHAGSRGGGRKRGGKGSDRRPRGAAGASAHPAHERVYRQCLYAFP